jgi:hypothetical protein
MKNGSRPKKNSSRPGKNRTGAIFFRTGAIFELLSWGAFRPVIANPEGEAIQSGTLDCFVPRKDDRNQMHP